jgi:hypothetical protein
MRERDPPDGVIVVSQKRSFVRHISDAVPRRTFYPGKDKSAMIASQAGRSAEIRQGDASYRPASRASGWPRTGSRPVQFGMAVRRNPATAAITKPNSISWICHAQRIEAGRQPEVSAAQKWVRMLPQLVLRHWFGSASRSPTYACWKAILMRVGGRSARCLSARR